MSNRFPQPQPQLLISPVQSEEEEEEDCDRTMSLGETEDDISTMTETESSSNLYFTGFPAVATIKVPTFESKMSKLSPIPLSVTPTSLRSRASVLSVRSSVSSRSMISEASTIFGPEKEQVLSEKMRTIVESFRSRARTVKQRIEQPPTPTDSLSGLQISLLNPQPSKLLYRRR